MAKLARKPTGVGPNANPQSQLTAEEKERRAENFIGKGGRTPVRGTATKSAKGRHSLKSDPEEQIGITVKLLVKERDTINDLREGRPVRERTSLQGWILEAVQEKIVRERAKQKS